MCSDSKRKVLGFLSAEAPTIIHKWHIYKMMYMNQASLIGRIKHNHVGRYHTVHPCRIHIVSDIYMSRLSRVRVVMYNYTCTGQIQCRSFSS